MSRTAAIGLFALGLLVYTAAAWFVPSPGYMDADYYYVTGLQLETGAGFVEPFLWNYLDDPAGIPHPSHLYWMPLPSLIAAAGLWIAGPGFRAAQAPFVLLAACLPLLAAQLSRRFGGSRRQAWTAGLLAAFPGFFLPFFVTTDAFALYAVIGGLYLWTAAAAVRRSSLRRWLLAGALAGLANLARADAPLLLLTGLLLILWNGRRKPAAAGLLLAGYLLVMAPWWARNLTQTGSIVNSGSARLLWMVNYDDLFAYPASRLSFERWQAAGLEAALRARWSALGTNLQRLLAENGLIFLAPLALIGGWRTRDRPFVRANAIYLTLLLAAMTVVFPFVGSRGGLFHSSTALMPGVWMLAPMGLGRAVRWIGRRRRWQPEQADRVFTGATVGLAAALTVGLFALRQVAPAARGQGWDAAAASYAEAARGLPAGEARVAVNNPPGFFLASERASIVIPDGDLETLIAAMTRYGASWVVLEANHPVQLAAQYRDPSAAAGLRLERRLTDAYGRPVYLLRLEGG